MSKKIKAIIVFLIIIIFIGAVIFSWLIYSGKIKLKASTNVPSISINPDNILIGGKKIINVNLINGEFTNLKPIIEPNNKGIVIKNITNIKTTGDFNQSTISQSGKFKIKVKKKKNLVGKYQLIFKIKIKRNCPFGFECSDIFDYIDIPVDFEIKE